MQLFIIDTFILEIAKITVINQWHIYIKKLIKTKLSIHEIVKLSA